MLKPKIDARESFCGTNGPKSMHISFGKAPKQEIDAHACYEEPPKQKSMHIDMFSLWILRNRCTYVCYGYEFQKIDAHVLFQMLKIKKSIYETSSCTLTLLQLWLWFVIHTVLY